MKAHLFVVLIVIAVLVLLVPSGTWSTAALSLEHYYDFEPGTASTSRWCSTSNSNWASGIIPLGGSNAYYLAMRQSSYLWALSPRDSSADNFRITANFNLLRMNNSLSLSSYAGAKFGLVFTVKGNPFEPNDPCFYNGGQADSGIGYYRFIIRINDAGTGYQTLLTRWENGVEPEQNGNYVDLPAGVTINRTGWNTMRIDRDGANIKAYINDTLVQNWDNGTGGTGGWFGLFTETAGNNPSSWYFESDWDNITVYNLDAATPVPTVTSIMPNTGVNTGTVHITNLAGSNFQTGATVKLTRSGQSDINATNVVAVSASQITCDLNLIGATTGQWNVVVTNPDSQSGILPNGFTVALSVAAQGCHVRLNDALTEWDNVQAAVDTSTQNTDVVKVAGTCAGVQVRPRNDITTTGVVTQVVYISRTVTVRGGYTTTNWTTPDPVANPTTLDAQGRGRVLFIAGNISPTVTGLRITGGDATGLGGHYFDAGGGVYIISATATLSNNRVFGNTAEEGGGVYLYHSASTFNGNTVTSNTAGFGGGMDLDYSDATLSGNTVTSNTASFGGGMYLVFDSIFSDASLSGNTITSNTAEGLGGGVYLWGGPATLSDNTVTSNTALAGGGMYVHFSTASLSGNRVSSNTAEKGGGLYLYYYSSPTLDNNVIADNTVTGSEPMGSGLYIYSSSPRLRHNTIARNIGGDGGGVYVTNDSWGPYSIVAMVNTILVNHTVGISVTGGNTVMVNGVLWFSTPITVSQATTATVTVQNQRQGNPAFAADGYHLTAGSAAIDAGVNAGVTTDIDGDPRPQGEGYDLGADEYPAGAPALTVTGITPASGLNTGTVHITNLAGSNFQTGATVKLTRSGQPDINATNVVRVTASQITCDFNLTGATTGQWNVVVTNPDFQSGTLPNSFTVTIPLVSPIVTSITPNTGVNTGAVHITNLAGSNFQTGATVKLTRSGQSDINATNVVWVSASQITCDLDMTGAATGQWNIVVTNPDSHSGTLSNGFTVSGTHWVYLPCVFKNYCPGPLYFDDFSDPNSGWSTGDNTNRRHQYLGGEFQVLVKATNYLAFTTPDLQMPYNVSAEVDARQASGPDGAYGILFGLAPSSPNDYYVFMVELHSTVSYYGLFKHTDSGWISLIDWNESTAIHNGSAVNHLKVVWNEGALRIFANDVLLDTYYAEPPFSGLRDMGIYAQSSDQGGVDMRFDNFRVSCPTP